MNTNEDSSSNTGGKGKFSERLKKISRDKRQKSKSVDKENKKDVRKIFKPFLVLTAFLYGSVKKEEKKQAINNDVSQSDNDSFNKIDVFDNDEKNTYNKKRNDANKVTNVVLDNVKLKPVITVDKQNCKDTIQEIKEYEKNVLDNLDKLTNIHSAAYNNEKAVEIRKLQKDIIGLIKKRLVKNINELEILSSEFYILKEVFHDDTYLNECQDKIKDIKKLLSKVKSLKEKYDYLKNNIDFDDLLYIDDNSLVDKIIELKDICTNEDIKNTIDNYKILEEYKSLYLKIDKLEEDVQKYNDYKEEKEKELEKRDIEFGKLKEEVYNKTYEQRRYDSFVKEQDMLIKKLDEQLMKIDSREVVSYKLKGFNQLLGSSFKYLGLLMASPFKGLFPSITMQTIATRKIIYNLYNSLEWEKEKKIIYETENFSSLINSAINDLEHTLNLVNTTVDDVRGLKEKYIKEFSKNQSLFSEYNEVIKKLNKMENAVLNNKVKIQLMKEKMKEKEKENDNKMKMVKKLNCSSNN